MTTRADTPPPGESPEGIQEEVAIALSPEAAQASHVEQGRWDEASVRPTCSPEDYARWWPTLEALLFAAERPLHAEEVAAVLERVDEALVSPALVEAMLARHQEVLQERGGGFALEEVAGGWELRTRAAHADHVAVLYRRKPVRLSRAALEVLAIIAFRQPCTRAEIDDIRGVDSSSTLKQVLERDLVRILGKADDIGRPLLYGTTEGFLRFFGLRSLVDLPTLREYAELDEGHRVQVEDLEQSLASLRAATDEAPTDPPHGAALKPPPSLDEI